MDLRLDGQVALVTGGSRGIGKAIAAAMVGSGAAVLISSRKQDALDAAAGEIDGEVATFAANAGDPEQSEACVDATLERFGRLDILVNNAATNPYFGPSIGIDLSAYDKTFQVNLRGPLWWTKLAHEKAFSAQGSGTVINVASIGGMSVEPMIGIYNTAKAALIHLTKQLANELAPVRVNAIAPGLVKTDFARALWEPAGERLAARLPTGRIGEPDDIAGAAVFLASDAASWITGHTLVVDGGALVASSALG